VHCILSSHRHSCYKDDFLYWRYSSWLTFENVGKTVLSYLDAMQPFFDAPALVLPNARMFAQVMSSRAGALHVYVCVRVRACVCE
jgi:hypothetical protein